ncbi:quinone-dependent dihydroorotate dehydrogenase [Chachezhania antarctica]|uniref:quinone-dependent dihydroorotate dehydrogenase n=1 Tax=Chachezhania antarctica TaxID=2340860 RepID=UPI003B84526E
MFEKLGMAALQRMDPEQAHGMALAALRMGMAPLPGVVTTDRLRTQVAGLDLPNPVGLAAGFDKHATALVPLSRAGFGFVEVGAVTPRPQPGNPRPRLFRLTDDEAVINRFGFNSEGMAAVAPRLKARKRSAGIVGLNLGANKDSADRSGDFAQVLTACGPYVDFVTVNVSSPNTEKLRDLQGKDALDALMARVMFAREELGRPLPVFLKIAPDLNDEDIADIAEVATTRGVDAIVATNTTLSREGLKCPQAQEAGGLSGAPLFELSTQVLARLHLATKGQIPLIGVGGIGSAADAYAKICAGASAVQLYSALVYKGLSLVTDIVRGLDTYLERDGFKSVAEATGVDRDKWL